MRPSTNKPQSEMSANPSKYPQGKFKDKPCKCCGKMFSPQAPSHLYCSQQCADDGWSHNYLKNEYGISKKTYDEVKHQQGHRCAICGGEGFLMKTTHWSKLVVDHDHDTGAVRGLLCHNCNRGLGLFKDNPQALREAADYLERATTIPQGSTPKPVEAHGNES
jgi:hypothetical protein